LFSAVPLTTHATGFSQWLMTNFSERRIHSALICKARLLPCRNFSVGQEPDPTNNYANRYSPFVARRSPFHYSPVANRQSLIAAVSARQ